MTTERAPALGRHLAVALACLACCATGLALLGSCLYRLDDALAPIRSPDGGDAVATALADARSTLLAAGVSCDPAQGSTMVCRLGPDPADVATVVRTAPTDERCTATGAGTWYLAFGLIDAEGRTTAASPRTAAQREEVLSRVAATDPLVVATAGCLGP